MSSDKHCCVPGCKDSGDMHRVLHGFPNPEKDRRRFNTWLYAIGGDILALENERIFKYRRVCNLHFEDRFLCRNNRISNVAVPTLNMPALLSSPPKYLLEKRPMLQDLNMITPLLSIDPESHQRTQLSYAPSSSMATDKDIKQKENIDPELHQRTQLSHAPSSSMATEKDVKQKENIGRNRIQTNRRLIQTKLERELHMKIVAAKAKVSKIKNKCKKLQTEVKKAKEIIKNPSMLDVLQNSSSTAKILMQMQWRENKKKDKGRRFTLKEKIVALSLLKQSPKGYRFFRKIFILPAPQTLVKLIQKCNLQPGLNKNIFTQLKEKCKKMEREEKLCVLLFDEVSLKANVMYNEKKDKVTGFVDNGQERKPDFADHAQVFMVRGLIKNYKQAVSYTFSASATKGPELAKQIKNIITELQQAGLLVVATVCDQGTNNRQAIKLLINETRGTYLRRGETPKENIILINDTEIIPLYDPPHLLKCMRNNLMTKNLHFEKGGAVKTAKWSHLQLLYKESPGFEGVRIIPKLTENHVNPEKLNKMKVKFAAQIFSRIVSSTMGYLADNGVLPSECRETAELLLFMDNMFDSVNGSFKKNKHAKPLLGPATPHSTHHKTWAEGKKIFKSMKFVTSAGKIESVPTVANWVWTLEGIEILLKKLHRDFRVSSVWLRHLNQDPLENFFGSIRSHGCRNINPTCDQFESAFATLLINSLKSVHTHGKNCERDFCDSLHALVVTDNSEAMPSSSCAIELGNILDINFKTITVKENDPRIIAPLQYLSGYFVKKAKTRIFKGCDICNENLTSTNVIEYINVREYAGQRWLCTPSNDLIELISNMQDIIYETLKENFEKKNLKTIITTSMFVLINFDFIKCNEHKKNLIDYIISIVIRCLVFNYCKNINNILAGKRDVDDEENNFQIKAKKCHCKCFKRKNKN